MTKNRDSGAEVTIHHFPRLTSGRVRIEFQDQFVENHTRTPGRGVTEIHMGYGHPRRWHLGLSHLSSEDARAVQALYDEVGTKIPFEFEDHGKLYQCVFEERPRMNWIVLDGKSVFDSGSANLRDLHGDSDAKR